jgi:hypothetical protein
MCAWLAFQGRRASSPLIAMPRAIGMLVEDDAKPGTAGADGAYFGRMLADARREHHAIETA